MYTKRQKRKASDADFCQHSSTWGEVVCGFWDDDGKLSLWSFSAGTFFFYNIWYVTMSYLSICWLTDFPQAFVHGMYEPGESFHTEPQAFSTGSLDGKNGQNKVFLGRIFRMATVFYCLALLKCSYSYSLFDRFRTENWWFRENLSSVHTHTNKHNGWNGKDWYIRFERSSIFGMTIFHIIQPFATLLFGAAHSPPRVVVDFIRFRTVCGVTNLLWISTQTSHPPKKTRFMSGVASRMVTFSPAIQMYVGWFWKTPDFSVDFRWVGELYQLAVSWGTKTNHGWLMRTPLLLANVYYVCFWVFDSAG